MNELDIQKLHQATECVLDPLTNQWLSPMYRVQPFLHMMLGEVWCGKEGQQYVYICDSRLDARDVCGQFVELLHNEDEGYAQTYHFTSDPIVVVSSTGQTFNFIPYKKALLDEYWADAIRDRVYINTNELSDQQLAHLHMDIIAAGADYI